MRPGLGIGDWRFGRAQTGRRARRRFTQSRIPNPQSPLSQGFSLIELLVALAVFAALAAAAYGGLAQLARTRGALAAQQERLAAVTHAVAALERDLRQSVSRSVLGNGRNDVLPGLAGVSGGVELTRLGYANPRAEPRSHLERVAYALDGTALRRARYAVLDRAPDTLPATTVLLERVDELRLRYLGCDGAWRDAWPPAQASDCGRPIERSELLPRAVEFRLQLPDLGEIRRVVELPSSSPSVSATQVAP